MPCNVVLYVTRHDDINALPHIFSGLRGCVHGISLSLTEHARAHNSKLSEEFTLDFEPALLRSIQILSSFPLSS